MRTLRPHRIWVATLIITMALVSASTSHAITQVSNLAEANTVNFGIGAHTHASSFITDGAGYTLNSVTLAIQSNSGSGFAQVKIRADSGGVPGAELEDLGSISPSLGASLITINSSGLALSPNTAYWISVGETGSGSNQWEGTTSTAEASPGSWTIGDQDFGSVGGGTTWVPTSFGPPNESSRFSVDATAGTASSVELLQGTVTAGAATVLQNAGGTVRLEQPRIGALAHPTFFVPEPVVLWQLGPGAVLLALLYARRQRIVSF